MRVGDLQRQQGMTLVELLVSLVIAAIIAILAAPSFTHPSFTHFLARQLLANDANDIISVLSFARSEATKQRNDTFRAWATPRLPVVRTHPAK